MLRCISRTCLVLVLAPAYGPAQNDQSPHFEVASVKSVALNVPMGYSEDAERVSCNRIPLTNLIAEAYNVGLDQITGPDWLRTEFYAITAKLPPGATNEQRPQMMANLLAERFGLVVHRVTREVPGYELTVAPGGPNLTPANPRAVADTPLAGGRGGFEQPMPDANGFPVLPPGWPWGSRVDDGIERMTFRGSSMAYLAATLRRLLSQSVSGQTTPISDQTGISGKFDFHLQIPALTRRLPPRLQLQTGQTSTSNGDPDVGTAEVSAALEKQLGLKLNPVKTKLDFIVIDHVNKTPTVN